MLSLESVGLRCFTQTGKLAATSPFSFGPTLFPFCSQGSDDTGLGGSGISWLLRTCQLSPAPLFIPLMSGSEFGHSIFRPAHRAICSATAPMGRGENCFHCGFQFEHFHFSEFSASSRRRAFPSLELAVSCWSILLTAASESLSGNLKHLRFS